MDKMDKRTKSLIAAHAIVFAAAAVIFFVVPFRRIPAAWLAFIFGELAVAVSLGICAHAVKEGRTLTSKIYGFPILRIGYTYLAAQLALTAVICILAIFLDVPAWVPVLLSVLMLGAALLGVIGADNARDFVEETDKETKRVIKMVTTFRIDMDGIADACPDERARTAVSRLADAFLYSDPVSGEATAEIEEQISAEIACLRSIVKDSSADEIEKKVSEIERLLSERNRICKASK